MKKIIAILLLIMVSSLCFAEIWMETKPGMTGINLENPDNLYNGTNGEYVKFDSYSPEYHCDKEMIGLVGFTGEPKKYYISFEFIGSAGDSRWMFSSIDNANYKIPFGIDFIARARPFNGDDYAVNINNLGTVISVGYQGRTIPENDYGGEIPITFDSSSMKGLWFDMVLVIPPQIRDLGNYGVSDNYQATIIINISDENKELIESFPFVISGYYGKKSEPSQINFSVVPNGNEKSLRLNELLSDDYTSIGRYIYTTETKSNNYASSEDSKYSLFISSSEDPNEPGNIFKLKLEGSYNSDYPEGLNTEVKFEIGLLSTYENEEWFSGQDTINGDKFLKCKVIQARNVNNTYSITYVDVGDIAIRLNDTQDVYNNLAYGNYHSEIYIHLISNF